MSSDVWLSKPYRALKLGELRELKRDICYLYHDAIQYSFIIGDLDYGVLPYWEYLNISGLYDDDKDFIQIGCLISILAMCWDVFDDAGGYIMSDNRIHKCQNALSTMESNHPDIYRLADAVNLALNTLQHNAEPDKHLTEEAAWIFERFVRGYFRENATR